MTKSNLGKKKCLWPITERTQGRNLKAGASAKAMEWCCLLTCSDILLSLPSDRTQDHQSKGSPTHMDWPLPDQSLILKNAYS